MKLQHVVIIKPCTPNMANSQVAHLSKQHAYESPHPLARALPLPKKQR